MYFEKKQIGAEKKIVLVINEDAQVSDAICETLTGAGYDVLIAYSWESGEALQRKLIPDAIVMDRAEAQRAGEQGVMMRQAPMILTDGGAVVGDFSGQGSAVAQCLTPGSALCERLSNDVNSLLNKTEEESFGTRLDPSMSGDS